jgi:hypothetical protein
MARSTDADSRVLLDRSGWHRPDDDYPACVPSANTATPLAFFVAWCAAQRWFTDAFEARHGAALSALRARAVGPREFVLRELKGLLRAGDLRPEAREGAADYLARRYRADFSRVLAADLPSPFHVDATWNAYDRLAPHLERAFRVGGRLAWWRRLLG